MKRRVQGIGDDWVVGLRPTLRRPELGDDALETATACVLIGGADATVGVGSDRGEVVCMTSAYIAGAARRLEAGGHRRSDRLQHPVSGRGGGEICGEQRAFRKIGELHRGRRTCIEHDRSVVDGDGAREDATVFEQPPLIVGQEAD